MRIKTLLEIQLFFTVVLICVVACSVPKHSEIDPNYTTPLGYYRNKPYFRNGGMIINITQLYMKNGAWHYKGELFILEKGKEKEFSDWMSYWQDYASKGTDKTIIERKRK